MAVRLDRSRLLFAALLSVAVAACGTAPEGSDAGDGTPDAGDTTPDAGGNGTPDAGGNDTPDAGQPTGPTFKLRVLNLRTDMGAFGVVAPPPGGTQPILVVSADIGQVSAYVDLPVGLPGVAFSESSFGQVDTSGFVEGDRVLVVVAVVQNTVAAAGRKEVSNTDSSKRLIQVGTTTRTFGLDAGAAGTLDVAAQSTNTILLDNGVTGFMYGATSENATRHFTTARIPAGGTGIIVATPNNNYILVPDTTNGAAAFSTLQSDVKVRPLVLTGSVSPLDVKFVAPFGEGTIATGRSLTSAATAYGWVPVDATSLTATDGGTTTIALANPFASFGEAGPPPNITAVVHGNPTSIFLTGSYETTSGGDSFSLLGAETNLRWRASVLNANDQATTWIPGANQHVEPRAAYSIGWGSAGGNFKLGFQMANTPSTPPTNASPEPIITLSGLPGYVEGFLFAWSGFRIAVITNEGAISIFPPIPN